MSARAFALATPPPAPATTPGRAGFMTDAMWFAWLLRPDVRQGAGIANHHAQREFTAWWLLDGAAAYPGAWSAPPDVCAVAMESVALRPGFSMPRLLRGLYRRRADLRRAYPLQDLENLYEFFAWYRAHGAAEMKIAPPLPPECFRHTAAPSLRPPWCDQFSLVPRIAARLHGDRADLQSHFDITTKSGRAGLAAWFAAQDGAAPKDPAPPPIRAARPRATRPGVNLIGYPSGEFGLGEDIRALAAALDSAGIATTVIELQRGSAARRNDRTLAARISETRRYDIDILCQTAFDTARCHLDGSLGPRNRYTIGYWPWELARLPPCWRDVYGLVDEIWAASRFTFAAYAADRPDMVHLMPPAICLEAAAPPPAAQGAPFGFLCAADPNSFLSRKNPLAALRAFRAAFPPDDTSVRLELHVNSCAPPPDWLQHAVRADPRCTLAAGTLHREAWLRRLSTANCLVSPHRAEGFGRGLAEAVLLGVPVLATGASGCLDFLEPDELIPWSDRMICDGEYPFGEFMHWAEPDEAALAAAMRRVRHAPPPPPARAARMAARCAPAVVGAAIARRIAEISKASF